MENCSLKRFQNLRTIFGTANFLQFRGDILEDFIKLLDQYGFSMLAAAILLYFAVYALNIGAAYLKKKLLPANKKTEFDINLEKRKEASLKIQYLLDRALLIADAVSAEVMEFHNGGNNLSNLPFAFMSCTYEAYSDVAASGVLQNISLSLHARFINALRNEPYLVLDAENRDPEKGGMIYEYLEAQKARFGLYAELKDLRGYVIGFVAIKRGKDFTEQDFLLLREIATEIGLLLSL
jgi:hypothetical protein